VQKTQKTTFEGLNKNITTSWRFFFAELFGLGGNRVSRHRMRILHRMWKEVERLKDFDDFIVVEPRRSLKTYKVIVFFGVDF